MNDKFKQIIFNKLYEDLKHVEIISHEDSIWFIGREEKYWFLRYRKSGKLWWRWDFFDDFFQLFCTERNEYRWILAEWVEEVLNCKVETPCGEFYIYIKKVEEVLNCKVETPYLQPNYRISMVEKVLNCKVETSILWLDHSLLKVEEVLFSAVKTIENER